ncbi:ABC transporter ATP-binding protein [Bosea sp. 117]|uniref:ABC transporter ATP-binding protein n=1 Tax=Bosea sp. 117 TaxID=1125973 RepID=UPI0004945F36|nr:ABC transporter ATP-binding protein [Bosea sp. 117]
MSAALEVRNLGVGYGARRIIDRLTLPPVVPGTVTGLIGPNAAGKTTLLRALAGLLPAEGSVRLGEIELAGLGPAAHAGHVTYMPQALPQRVALTVLEAVLTALMSAPTAPAGAAARRRAMEALDRLGIASLASRGLDELSGGQRQLASLAQCLVREPKVLLLDEPTSALDLRHQLRVMQLVDEIARDRDIIAMVVLHDITLAARWCRRLIVLAEGAVAADGPPEEAVTPALLADVYGVEARVEADTRGHVQVMVDRAL